MKIRTVSGYRSAGGHGRQLCLELDGGLATLREKIASKSPITLRTDLVLQAICSRDGQCRAGQRCCGANTAHMIGSVSLIMPGQVLWSGICRRYRVLRLQAPAKKSLGKSDNLAHAVWLWMRPTPEGRPGQGGGSYPCCGCGRGIDGVGCAACPKTHTCTPPPPQSSYAPKYIEDKSMTITDTHS